MGMCVPAGCGQARSEAPAPGPVVARADAVTVTAEAFRRAYVAYLQRTGVPDRPALRRAFLDDLVAARLLAAEARARGIEATPAYQFRHAEVRRKLLIEAYTHRVLFDTLTVREADVRAAFVRAHTKVHARHLYARTRAEAEVLRARLLAGETFETLAHEVFTDPALAETGGDLGEIGFDEMDAGFEEVAFALPLGEISEPVQTAQGYSILRVDARRVEGLLTEAAYAEQRGRLVPYVRHRQRAAARRAHARRLRAEAAPAYHAEGFALLLAHVTGEALVPEGEAFAAFLAQPLVTVGEKTWTVGDFREEARFSEARQRAQIRHRADLEAFIDALVVRRTMLDRAATLGLEATPAFSEALAEEMDEWIVQQEHRRRADEIVVREDAIREVFETAPAGTFTTFAEAQPTIREQLRYRAIEAQRARTYDALRARYPVEIDTDVLYSLSLNLTRTDADG